MQKKIPFFLKKMHSYFPFHPSWLLPGNSPVLWYRGESLVKFFQIRYSLSVDTVVPELFYANEAVAFKQIKYQDQYKLNIFNGI